MTIFAVVNVADSTLIQAGLEEHFKDHHLQIGDGIWLVSAQGQTVRQVATKLRLGDEDGGSITAGLVISVKGYYGRQNNNVWEWFAGNSL